MKNEHTWTSFTIRSFSRRSFIFTATKLAATAWPLGSVNYSAKRKRKQKIKSVLYPERYLTKMKTTAETLKLIHSLSAIEFCHVTKKQ